LAAYFQLNFSYCCSVLLAYIYRVLIKLHYCLKNCDDALKSSDMHTTHAKLTQLHSSSWLHIQEASRGGLQLGRGDESLGDLVVDGGGVCGQVLPHAEELVEVLCHGHEQSLLPPLLLQGGEALLQ
jgi:hypothetical protein